MANLRYSNKHNMVAFLKKPTKSVGFTEIVDFLKGTSLRTLSNGIQELVASIHNKEYTITEASIRSQLQLADATVPSITTPPPISKPQPSSPPWSILRQGTEIPQSQGPTVTPVADEATTIGVGVETEGATTTTTGLDAGLDSGNIHKSPLRSHEAPLPSLEKELKETKQTLGNVVLTLVKKVKSLKVDLKRMSKRVILSDSEDEEIENQGRKIQDIDDDPLFSLVRNSMEEKEADIVTPKKVASQKVSTYRRRARSVSKGKDIGIGLDFFSATKERLKSAEIEVNTEVNPGSAGVNIGNTPISTPSVIRTVNVIVPSSVKSQREGKAPMISEDDEEDARQVHLDAMLAKRIQEEQELSEQQQKRKAEVQEAAHDDFAKRMVDMINQKKKYYAEQKAKAKRDKPMIQAQQRDYMSTFIKNLSSWKMVQLKKLTFDELKVEFEKLMRSIESFMPMGSEERVKRAGVQLEQESSKKQKIVVEDVPVTEEKVEVVKKEEPIKRTGKRKKQKARKGTHADKIAKHEAEEDMEALVKGNDTDSSSGTDIPVSDVPVAIKPPSIANWKIIKLGNKADIYMLTERRYPIPANVCQAMLDKNLHGDKKNEACYQLGGLLGIKYSRLNSVSNTVSSASTHVSTVEVVQIVLWIVDSGCSKHMTGDRSLLRNFIEKFMGTVRFGNDNFAAITGYGDYIQGNITICHVYYVEGDDLLTGGRESNLYTISISDMAASSPVCLMSNATSTKSWLWHRRLSHLNFGTINDLTRLDLVDGLPKFKYGKDHLCSACERGKSKKASRPPKLVLSDHSKLELLHMDLCGPMRIQVIGDPSKPVMTLQKLQIDYEVYMYALTISTIELKNIKEAMADHSWIESMQDEQEEGIDFEESFAHVARLEDVQMFIAYAAYKNITILSIMDCKDDSKSTSGGLQFLGEKIVS
ncbi:integrase, catalytic region, zinc finger, CCHC-type containing protein [Tanacetum coccineum]